MVTELTVVHEPTEKQTNSTEDSFGPLSNGEIVMVTEIKGLDQDPYDPFRAFLACPGCGVVGIVSQRQLLGLIPVTCCGKECSTQFVIHKSRAFPLESFISISPLPVF